MIVRKFADKAVKKAALSHFKVAFCHFVIPF
jgi:hypothetical protein